MLVAAHGSMTCTTPSAANGFKEREPLLLLVNVPCCQVSAALKQRFLVAAMRKRDGNVPIVSGVRVRVIWLLFFATHDC